MKNNADFYFDFNNREQVNCWNKIGVNLSNVKAKNIVLNKATNRREGAYVWLNDNTFKEYVINKMNELYKGV